MEIKIKLDYLSNTYTHKRLFFFDSNILNIKKMFYLQRKRHRLALKKKRCLSRKEQAAEYAKLLAQRQKEAKNRRQEELKRRRSASLRESKSSTQTAPAGGVQVQ